MSKNIGGIDRILRLVAGTALVALAATGVIGLWGYIGVLPLLTAAIGWCPGYSFLGVNTCGCKRA